MEILSCGQSYKASSIVIYYKIGHWLQPPQGSLKLYHGKSGGWFDKDRCSMLTRVGFYVNA